ncbi:GH3 auxin-responsive promoter [Calothrix sp. NIES-4071]|nr:GH3 auxin-responsive promoter [Calothrix sp. NIES-4071]BAZ61094.1 GH3 auxin-responsive promoter [Calothrix sp. NIES-4105]
MRILIQLFAKLFAPATNRFYRALQNPELAQKNLQKELFQRFTKSEYGKSLNITSLNNWRQIPIVEYQDIQTKLNQLTHEPIIFYEKTSGSRSAAKLIPYTQSLRRSFNHMFCVWAHDLIVNGSKFSTGKIYFCISPQLTQPTDVTTLEDDSQYLDGWLRLALSPFLVSPSGIQHIHNAEEFKHKLSQALLLAEDLEIISIWSPSFLKVMLDYIQSHHKQLASELKAKISAERYNLLLETPEYSKLWRQLKLISCWDSANAADGAEMLRKLFPDVLVQGKGLLATEAPMTIPLIAANGCVPMLDEVFFEFEDKKGNIYLLHELQKGEVYEIIISQKGGLYRYRIKDRVRVTHFYQATPCLEFIGRTKEVSDLVGEKLHSEFVRQVLNNLPLTETSFKSFIPTHFPTARYILLLDMANTDINELAQKLDILLQQSHQYRHARLLGQLAPPQIIVNPRVAEILSLHKTRSGKKWGDLKHDILGTAPISKELLSELNNFF